MVLGCISIVQRVGIALCYDVIVSMLCCPRLTKQCISKKNSLFWVRDPVGELFNI